MGYYDAPRGLQFGIEPVILTIWCPFINGSFAQISNLYSYFNPQHTHCILAVKIFVSLDLEQITSFTDGHFLRTFPNTQNQDHNLK
jgi:hypothetical protein